jgi:hypothetical protein
MPGWWAVLACAAATVLALCSDHEAIASIPGSTAASANATNHAAAPSSGAPSALGPSAEPPTAAPAQPPTKAKDMSHGRAPLHGGGMVPLKWMPPGTNASPLPSDRIFPPQSITIRFNHKKHVKVFKQSCKTCHAAAYKSVKGDDRLLPDPAKTCDNCHDSDHSNLAKVANPDGDITGQCGFCHLGENPGKGGQVAKMVYPRPNLRMNHKAHLDRNIQCAQCHGHIENLELATREQLPRMAGCFSCHAMSGAARGKAKGDCTNCHLTEPNGKMKTEFSAGALQPPQWLHGAAHTPDWLARHKGVAGANSQLCASCHTSKWCNDCHDGRIRPRNVHPNDWISLHPQSARQDNPRCVSCHNLQSFCADCHRRVGVARDAPSANRLAGRRFHPPPAIWTTAPRSPQHHAWEAQRNINACVSCHTERDCTTCHASKGVRGGQGVNPHTVGFASRCRTPFKRNPRPCFVCHSSSDTVLSQCQ